MAGAAEATAALAATGVALLGLGTALVLWATLQLRTAAGTLADEGPYAFSRHPMYLGAVLALAGLGPALGQPLAALAAPAFAVLAQGWLVPREEARLLARHGGWYSDYAATVRRWL